MGIASNIKQFASNHRNASANAEAVRELARRCSDLRAVEGVASQIVRNEVPYLQYRPISFQLAMAYGRQITLSNSLRDSFNRASHDLGVVANRYQQVVQELAVTDTLLEEANDDHLWEEVAHDYLREGLAELVEVASQGKVSKGAAQLIEGINALLNVSADTIQDLFDAARAEEENCYEANDIPVDGDIAEDDAEPLAAFEIVEED